MLVPGPGSTAAGSGCGNLPALRVPAPTRPPRPCCFSHAARLLQDVKLPEDDQVVKELTIDERDAIVGGVYRKLMEIEVCVCV